MSCQLKVISLLQADNSFLDNLWQCRIRSLCMVKRRIYYFKNRVARALSGRLPNQALSNIESIQLRAGDMVKVRSRQEIKDSLNEWGARGGCSFTPDMYRFCGNKYRVFKEVNYFYDEVKRKMCKCKNMVLLEDVLCSGQLKLFPGVCDRNCFLFWHTAWLMKL